MYMLEAINIKKNFNKLEVLKGVSLQVRQGEVISIIGPSGSGKSTFLRCLIGLEAIDERYDKDQGERGKYLPGRVYGDGDGLSTV